MSGSTGMPFFSCDTVMRAARHGMLRSGSTEEAVIENEDYALGIACLFFCGGLAAVIAPANPSAAMLIAAALVLLSIAAIWAARDASNVPDKIWRDARRSKAVWRNVLLFFAPLGFGGLAAIAYFAAVRPQLEADSAEPPS